MRYVPTIVTALGTFSVVIFGIFWTKDANCLWGLFALIFAVLLDPDIAWNFGDDDDDDGDDDEDNESDDSGDEDEESPKDEESPPKSQKRPRLPEGWFSKPN
jgi:hypothetical protein